MPWNCTFQSINSPHTSPAAASTVCPRSSDSFHILMYYIKWVTTSWTYCRYVIWGGEAFILLWWEALLELQITACRQTFGKAYLGYSLCPKNYKWWLNIYFYLTHMVNKLWLILTYSTRAFNIVNCIINDLITFRIPKCLKWLKLWPPSPQRRRWLW